MTSAVFYMQLGFKYGSYWHAGSVFGPFESRGHALDSIYALHPEPKDEFLIFHGELLTNVRTPSEKTEGEKRAPGDLSFYREKPGKSGYSCKECGADIMGVTVHHPVWFKGLGTAGGGEVKTSQAPYCPNCETKPSSSGAPVYE